MVFSSSVFLFLFLPLVLLIYYNPWIKGRGFRNNFLVLASLGFYAWGEPVFVLLMIASIVFTWFIGLQLEKNNSKKILTLGICAHVVILFIFKYASFAASQLGMLFHNDDIELKIALPIGISFFTFQLMSYLFDIYYGKAKAQKNLLQVALYVSLFPQLIAGPIVRYSLIEYQILHRKESMEDVMSGMQRFVYGLGKKVLIANYVAQIVDNCFDYLLGNTSVSMMWLGSIAYTLQIYFDFSGYSDMAIGLGRMFGFHFEENFNYPFISKTVTEYWRRWHISLSAWFKDYVYIPLGGNRVSKSRWMLNMLIVWLLTGFWHGANWTYMTWGLIYYVVLVIEKQIKSKQSNKISNNACVSVVLHIYTLLVVMISLTVFRAADIHQAGEYLVALLGKNTTGLVDQVFIDTLKNTWFILLCACVGSTPLPKNIMTKIKMTKVAFLEQVWIVIVFILSMMQVISSTYNPFIYFNF